ncbi:hypothetical protein KAU43_07505 [candidate division WOR-3 bacterium]|nr:hypothetical protein [candidate division WOR-3 bacterium]
MREQLSIAEKEYELAYNSASGKEEHEALSEQMKILKRVNAWKVAEHELMLMLEDPDVRDDWLEEGRTIHLGKANRGELETDPAKIFDRLMKDFGADHSWYAQLVATWLFVAQHNTMPLPNDEKVFYKAYDIITKIKARIDHRNEGFYDCMGCRNEKNRYQDGYNMIKGVEHCDGCAKKIEGYNFGEVTQERYIEALKVYLDHAYPDDKPIWTLFGGERRISDIESPKQKRDSILFNASTNPHRSHFFKNGIPTSITFGSWIQPHMKVRYDGEHLWVESNEESDDGKSACELSRQVKHNIEHAWQELEWMPTIDSTVHYLENHDSEETLCCILLDEGKKIFTTTKINKVDCSHCRKILIHKGLMFDNRTKRDCQKCFHPHQQSEMTGEALGCTKAGCGCKDFDDGE